MKYSAVIVAAGSGSRMNLGYNKVLYEMEPGVRVLDKSLALFQSDPDCAEIIVVLSEGDYTIALPESVKRAHGGATRAHSVYGGVSLASQEYVMIHDGARPYLSQEVVDRLKEALKEYSAAFPAIPEKDTIREVNNGIVVKTLERSLLYHAQTPQAFRTDLILKSLKKVLEDGVAVTDDVQAVEYATKEKIKMVLGDEANRKLTVKEDLK